MQGPLQLSLQGVRHAVPAAACCDVLSCCHAVLHVAQTVRRLSLAGRMPCRAVPCCACRACRRRRLCCSCHGSRLTLPSLPPPAALAVLLSPALLAPAAQAGRSLLTLTLPPRPHPPARMGHTTLSHCPPPLPAFRMGGAITARHSARAPPAGTTVRGVDRRGFDRPLSGLTSGAPTGL